MNRGAAEFIAFAIFFVALAAAFLCGYFLPRDL